MTHHTNTPVCTRCEELLARVHPDLARWFRMLRAKLPDAHISCGYRGEVDQEAAFTQGLSHAHYGQSAHNQLPAMAIDLFRLTQAGGASFDAPWYRDQVGPVALAAGLVWGITYKDTKGRPHSDLPHVEMPGFVPFHIV